MEMPMPWQETRVMDERMAFIVDWRRKEYSMAELCRRYLGASPSKKGVSRLKRKVSDLLVPGNKCPWPEVRDQLNGLLLGWSSYFSYGTRLMA